MPIHLLLPLAASLLFVLGLIFVKRCSTGGVGTWTVTFIANVWASIAFSTLWILGGTMQPATLLWQPGIIALLYILGQVFTFCAIAKGDVSVATPVFGIKVLLVAILLTAIHSQPLPIMVWFAAALATAGIVMVQWTARAHVGGAPHGVAWTVLLASSAACSFALFDVLVQRWAPAWGPGRFLPIVYWMVAFLSLGFLPFAKLKVLANPAIRPWLLLGTLLIALQAICIVFALSKYGDAARVNVVYALRGLWGVTLAWAAARIWGGSEADLPRRVMATRLAGATLLTVAVILAVLTDGIAD